MKRSGPLARRTPLARTGRLRPRSAKRAAKARDFAPVRAAVFARDGHRCQAEAHARNVITTLVGDLFPLELPDEWPACWAELHPHHLNEQGAGGSDDPENLLTVCAAHHRWIHDHPTLAKQMDLLR